MPNFPSEIPENPLFEKSRFSEPFRQKLLLLPCLQLALILGSMLTPVWMILSNRGDFLANGMTFGWIPMKGVLVVNLRVLLQNQAFSASRHAGRSNRKGFDPERRRPNKKLAIS
jgi:hypothetical protein